MKALITYLAAKREGSDQARQYVASVQNKKIELFQQSFGAHGPSKAEMIRERLKVCDS